MFCTLAGALKRKPHHAVPHARQEQPPSLGPVPGHHDVWRPDRAGRSRRHRGRRARPRGQLHRHGRRVHQGCVGDHAGQPAQGPAPRLGAGHQTRQQDIGPGERRPLFTQLDAARAGQQPAAPADRPCGHSLHAPRRHWHGPGRAAACHRRDAARGQDPLLGRVQLSRLAYCRNHAHRRPAGHARPHGVPALLQPAEPHARGGNFARLQPLRHRCHVVQPGGSGCTDRQIRPRPSASRRHPHGTRRQTYVRDRIPRRVAGHCANIEGTCRSQGHHAGPVRHRLGAGPPRRQLCDCRAAHAAAMAGLPARAGLHRGT